MSVMRIIFGYGVASISSLRSPPIAPPRRVREHVCFELEAVRVHIVYIYPFRACPPEQNSNRLDERTHCVCLFLSLSYAHVLYVCVGKGAKAKRLANFEPSLRANMYSTTSKRTCGHYSIISIELGGLLFFCVRFSFHIERDSVEATVAVAIMCTQLMDRLVLSARAHKDNNRVLQEC